MVFLFFSFFPKPRTTKPKKPRRRITEITEEPLGHTLTSDLQLANIALSKNDLPVPPGALRKVLLIVFEAVLHRSSSLMTEAATQSACYFWDTRNQNRHGGASRNAVESTQWAPRCWKEYRRLSSYFEEEAGGGGGTVCVPRTPKAAAPLLFWNALFSGDVVMITFTFDYRLGNGGMASSTPCATVSGWSRVRRKYP